MEDYKLHRPLPQGTVGHSPDESGKSQVGKLPSSASEPRIFSPPVSLGGLCTRVAGRVLCENTLFVMTYLFFSSFVYKKPSIKKNKNLKKKAQSLRGGVFRTKLRGCVSVTLCWGGYTSPPPIVLGGGYNIVLGGYMRGYTSSSLI